MLELKTALLSFLLSLASIQGQRSAPLAIEEYKRGLNPKEEIPLFDLDEIKARKIDTVYIIYHLASWAEYDSVINPCTCSYSDTLFKYVFDEEGRIIALTHYQQLGDFSYTMHYDTSGHLIGRTNYRRYGANRGSKTTMFPPFDSTQYKEVLLKRKEGTDSITTLISFWKFKKGLDTAIIVTKRYNSKGKLIEEESEVSKKNEREINDDTGGATYHYKYDYDEQGRLVYYQSFGSNRYEIISYPFYGTLTEVYNVTTNQIENRRVKLIKEENGVITSTFDNRRTVTLTPLEKGSKLFKLRTIIDQGEIPLLYYHEFVYKRR